MTHLGAIILGSYSLVFMAALAIYHAIKFVKKKDTDSELIVTLIIPVLIYLANVV